MSTWQEKRQARFQRWLEPGVPFTSPETKAAYQGRVQIMIDAIELKKTPDRVPIYPNYTYFPAYALGSTPREVMSDVKKAVSIWEQFVKEYGFDAFGFIGIVAPIPIMKALDYKLYQWPGSGGIPEDSIYRYFEHDWLVEAKEYDDLALDPTDWWQRQYIPRFCGALSGFTKLPNATEFMELPNLTSYLAPFGLPEVQESLKKLMEIGTMTLEWMGEIGNMIGKLMCDGYPPSAGGFAKAPFDTLSDTLRSFKTAMLDLRRNGDRMIAAMDTLAPLAIKMAVESIDKSGNPIVFMPLHKGADGFMSKAQFEKFYWPSLKRVFEGIIEAGGVPVPFAEGGYNQRMDYLNELPKGSVAWMIDRSDMKELKKTVGGNCCLIGNVPSSILHAGTPADVDEYVKNLINDAGAGGGLMLATGTVTDDGRPEMIKAMIAAGLKYGKY
jgi:uroporphyrinogen-III decarboxylase